MASLYPFQAVGVTRVLLSQGHRLILRYPTGCGKSPTAIVAASKLEVKNVLIVTPAIVRSHWLRELDRWWPEHPQAAGITVGRGRSKGLSKRALKERNVAYSSPILCTSYSLLDDVRQEDWDLIIWDEIHRLQAPASKQTKAARVISQANPQAAMIGCTATLMPNDIKDVWSPIDIMWPGRFGKYNEKYPKYQPFAFLNRYCLKEDKWSEDGEERYGTKWYGINPVYSNELKFRLNYLSHSVSKEEAAPYLPPFLVSLLQVKSEKKVRYGSIKDWEEKNGEQKIPYILEWLEDAIAENTHCLIGVHRKILAEQIFERIRLKFGEIPSYCITGDRYPSPEGRNCTLEEARRRNKAVIVGTVDSIGIGISLTFCTSALVAELHARPETMIQFLGRLSRMDSHVPSSVQILALEGTADERMAQLIKNKIDRINEALPIGASDEKLREALEIKIDPKELLASLDAALNNVKEDIYGY